MLTAPMAGLIRSRHRRPNDLLSRLQEWSMSHTRIRKFNTRDTYPEQNLDNDLCQAVRAGATIYLRGQVGQDLDTRASVGVGDAEAQAERAMANIAMLLEEAGGALEDIVKVVVYLTDVRYRVPVYLVMGRRL